MENSNQRHSECLDVIIFEESFEAIESLPFATIKVEGFTAAIKGTSHCVELRINYTLCIGVLLRSEGESMTQDSTTVHLWKNIPFICV